MHGQQNIKILHHIYLSVIRLNGHQDFLNRKFSGEKNFHTQLCLKMWLGFNWIKRDAVKGTCENVNKIRFTQNAEIYLTT